MKKSVFHILWGVVSALQLLLLGGALLLSRLAYSKGGVNHHVSYRKRQYNELIFTEKNLLLAQVALAAAALLLLWLLLRAARQKRGTAVVLAAGSLIFGGLLFYELTAPAFQAIAIYPYAVLVTLLLFALECALLIVYQTVREP